MRTNFLQLVNPDYPILDEERPQLLVPAPFTTSNILLDATVATELTNLIETLKIENDVIVTDGYRTKKNQQDLWDETIKERGITFTNKYVAKPGCSEHELGLAVDIGLKNTINDPIKPTFSTGPIVARFLSNMADFGFILRYPKGKESITHISYEPWHFRYVGTPHSQIMKQQDWVLEEYVAFLNATRGQVNEG